MSESRPTPPTPRSAPAPPARADGPRRDSIWRALLFLLALVLILITVWHAVDQITTRHAEEAFAGRQTDLRIARLQAQAHVAAAEAARDSAIATAGIAAAHSLAGSGSKRLEEILAAITDAISRAGSSPSSTTP
jgi:hypothetical protein